MGRRGLKKFTGKVEDAVRDAKKKGKKLEHGIRMDLNNAKTGRVLASEKDMMPNRVLTAQNALAQLASKIKEVDDAKAVASVEQVAASKVELDAFEALKANIQGKAKQINDASALIEGADKLPNPNDKVPGSDQTLRDKVREDGKREAELAGRNAVALVQLYQQIVTSGDAAIAKLLAPIVVDHAAIELKNQREAFERERAEFELQRAQERAAHEQARAELDAERKRVSENAAAAAKLAEQFAALNAKLQPAEVSSSSSAAAPTVLHAAPSASSVAPSSSVSASSPASPAVVAHDVAGQDDDVELEEGFINVAPGVGSAASAVQATSSSPVKP